MRHRKKFNHLSRTSAHRKAMLSNMATSLIMHKRITTTVAKAKALRSYVEPLLTRSKEDTMHQRRTVFSYLHSKEAVNELFREVSTKIAERPGGYTRIIKMGNRIGDNAELAMIELVDYNEHLLGTEKASEEKSGRRRRRRKSSAKTQQNDAPVQADTVAEADVKADEVTSETPKEEIAEAKADAPAEEAKEEKEDKPEEENSEAKKAE